MIEEEKRKEKKGEKEEEGEEWKKNKILPFVYT